MSREGDRNGRRGIQPLKRQREEEGGQKVGRGGTEGGDTHRADSGGRVVAKRARKEPVDQKWKFGVTEVGLGRKNLRTEIGLGKSTIRTHLQSIVWPLYTFFASMSGAMELDVPDLGRQSANVEEETARASSQARSVAVTENLSSACGVAASQHTELVTSAANSEGLKLFSDLDAFSFIASLPPLSSIMNRPQVCLPAKRPNTPRNTLVLDLDETLVHCSTEKLEKSDLTFPVLFRNVEYKVFVRRRPHLENFLTVISGLFEVIVFTASHRVYADRLLDILDPEKRFFDHRVFRDSCLFHVGNYVKDLSVLGRDLTKTVIIDNSPQAFGFHVDNGIPISTWTVQDGDDALLRLIPLLHDVADAVDVRQVLREKIGLSKMISEFKAVSGL